MILEIVKYGNPILSGKAQAVDQFDRALQELVADMFETMYAARGAGLAAPQVGVKKNVFVMDCSSANAQRSKIVVVNPVIRNAMGALIAQEGCLSLPKFVFDIERPTYVQVSGQDTAGNNLSLELVDYEARCACHEVDHLDGKLLISRVSPVRRDLTVSRIRKLKRLGRW